MYLFFAHTSARTVHSLASAKACGCTTCHPVCRRAGHLRGWFIVAKSQTDFAVLVINATGLLCSIPLYALFMSSSDV